MVVVMLEDMDRTVGVVGMAKVLCVKLPVQGVS